MATLSDIQKRFEALQGKEIGFAAEALQESEKTAMDLVAGQLAQGIKSDGQKADFTYTPFTIASKKQKSGLASVTSHLTNYDTGESYKGLYLKVEGESVKVGTSTDKEAAISDRMDEKAFSPNKDSREILVAENMQPAFNKKIRSFLKL